MIEPGAPIFRAGSCEAKKVGDRAFETNRGWVQPADGWEISVWAGEAQDRKDAVIGKRHVNRIAIAPEADQREGAARKLLARLAPRRPIDRNARPGVRSAEARATDKKI